VLGHGETLLATEITEHTEKKQSFTFEQALCMVALLRPS
jgi:hypothetical protein